MSATLILVMNRKTAKAVSKIWGGITITPQNPSMKDIRVMTQTLAEGKPVVGFLKTLSYGWSAPSSTTVVIHPECEVPGNESFIAQAKMRPRPINLVPTPVVDEIEVPSVDGKKKERIEQLEKRLRVLLSVVTPFSALAKGIVTTHNRKGIGGKTLNLVTEDVCHNVVHYGQFKDLSNLQIFKVYSTTLTYDPEEPTHTYSNVPNDQIADVSFMDFENLHKVVSLLMSTVPEDIDIEQVVVKEKKKKKNKNRLVD